MFSRMKSGIRLQPWLLAALAVVVLGVGAGCDSVQDAMDIWTKHIHPAAGSTYDIGDNATRYRHGYFDNVTAHGLAADNATLTELWIADNTSIHTADNSTFGGGGAGAQGPIGPQGPAGDNGTAGATWYTGAGAPDAGVGVNNDLYLNTTTSDVYKKSTGAWGVVANIKGTAGINGTDGKTVRNGSGAPDAGLGVDGDFYIDTTAHAIYGPKSGAAWGSSTSLVGPAGATGAQGPQGATGATGAQGATGEQGPPGPSFYHAFGVTAKWTGSEETNTQVWNSSSATPSRSSTQAHTGTYSEKLLATGASPCIWTYELFGPASGGCWGGVTIYARFWAYVPLTNSADGFFQFFDQSGWGFGSGQITLTRNSAWTQYSATYTITTYATNIIPALLLYAGGNGDVEYFDDVVCLVTYP